MNLVNTKIKQEFDADGYVAIYSFFEDNKIQEIKNEIDRYIVDIGPTLPNHHVFYEDKSDKTTIKNCLLYTSPSPRDGLLSRMPSSA